MHSFNKLQAFNKFRSEYPGWFSISPAHLKGKIEIEKRKKKKLKELEEIMKLRFENHWTLRRIAKRFGVSYQAIDNKLKFIKK